jgi:hypothetical protein
MGSINARFVLVTEVAGAGEDHCNAMLIGSGNDFLIAHAATWLNRAACTCSNHDIEAIPERKEGIAGNCRGR